MSTPKTLIHGALHISLGILQIDGVTPTWEVAGVAAAGAAVVVVHPKNETSSSFLLSTDKTWFMSGMFGKYLFSLKNFFPIYL